ncbi:hypothetical protein AwWohl_14420 [Gammaproteobacteria bacterium]|nr:hypothetical protein AwWohl_14420 [Gammaproteobacteria bacterium]
MINKDTHNSFSLTNVMLVFILSLCLLISGCTFKKSSGSTGSTVSNATKATALKSAKQQIGVPYRYGGSNPKQGFDCSGLILHSYSQAGIKIPRTTKEQFKAFKPVKNPAIGDLVFFGSRGTPNHAGIYVGNNKMLHAPSTGKKVEIVTLSPAWKKRYLGARIVTKR